LVPPSGEKLEKILLSEKGTRQKRETRKTGQTRQADRVVGAREKERETVAYLWCPRLGRSLRRYY
jgi:hypothetical protein